MPITPEDLNATIADAIAAAIDTRHRLGFNYRGLPRVVNPVRLGRSAQGDWILRAVQVGGESTSGNFGGRAPKLFRVDEMSDVEVMTGEFRIPRQAFPDDAFASVTAELRRQEGRPESNEDAADDEAGA